MYLTFIWCNLIENHGDDDDNFVDDADDDDDDDDDDKDIRAGLFEAGLR